MLVNLTHLQQFEAFAGGPCCLDHLAPFSSISRPILHPRIVDLSNCQHLDSLRNLRQLEISNRSVRILAIVEGFPSWMKGTKSLPKTQRTFESLPICKRALGVIGQFENVRDLRLLNSKIACSIAPKLKGI